MTIAPHPPDTELLTYERYVQEFMDERPTLQPYDIIEGVHVFVNSPLPVHQIGQQTIRLNIVGLLRHYQHRTCNGIVIAAPFDVLIRRTPRLQVRQPDVLFITNDRVEQSGGIMMEGPLTTAPQLIIEVLSPSETRRTVQDKIEDFRSIGLEEAWLVSSQAETVQILRLTSDGVETIGIHVNGQTLQSRVFPDLSVDLADVFAV